MSEDELLELFRQITAAVMARLAAEGDWGLVPGSRALHHSDLAADSVVVELLERAGLGVLSEESGLHHAERDVLVVVDPLDGSTNASLGLPWYAVSLCAVDAGGPLVALVTNLASHEAFYAIRGRGAYRSVEGSLDWMRITPSGCSTLSDAVIGISGMPPGPLGWRQFRAYGAAALDLCSVACGRLDGFVDCSVDAHGVWDYLGGVLVCQEAEAVCGDALDRSLVILDPVARRTPVAGATPELLASLLAARRQAFEATDEVERG